MNLLLAVLICFTFGACVAKNEKIIGGYESEPHRFPFAAGLWIDGEYFCGGTIINENYILSGAHCLENAQLVEVIVGAHNISDPNEVGQVRLTSTEIKIHEGWSSFFARDDLALVKLPVPLVFDNYTQAVERVTEEPGVDASTTVIGWGNVVPSFDASINDVLNYYDGLFVVSDATCGLTFGPLNDYEKVVCVATEGAGSCFGDTGGPLVDSLNRLVGVSSYFAGECNTDRPNAFSSIALYNDWIDANAVP